LGPVSDDVVGAPDDGSASASGASGATSVPGAGVRRARR